MNKFAFFFIVIGIVLFSGCSTKEVFEPTNIAGEWEDTATNGAKIIDKTSNVALLENKKVLYGEQELSFTIPTGYRILGVGKEYLLYTNIDGDLTVRSIKNDEQKYHFHLKKTIAAASTDGDVVAVVFADGDMGLYSLATQELELKIDGATSIAVDARIVNPYFMNDLVLFLTLDGKVVIVNKRLKKRLRTIIISGAEYFNNVIYFDILKDKLIVATATKVLSFGSSQQRAESEARNITHDKEHLYIATKQGDIVYLDERLQQQGKVHFPFAHFLALQVKGDKIYALEKEGYLIVLSKDLLEYKIYEVDIEDESYVYATENAFIVGDKKVIFKDEATK